MKIKNVHLHSGSLISVLFISLLISIILLNLIFIEHFFTLFDKTLDIQETERIDCNNEIKSISFENNKKLSKWGAYYIYKCKERDDLEKTVLLGKALKKTIPTLYLPDKNQKLVVTGCTYIKGNIFLPKEGISYQNLNEFESFSGFYKKTYTYSKKQLPILYTKGKLKYNDTKDIKYIDIKTMITDKSDDYYNSFFNPTIKINCSYKDFDNSVGLSGNIILDSKDSILIKSHSKLENIIIISPKVRIENGFKGKVQIYSTKSIIVGKDSYLFYPSFLSVFNDQQEGAKIEIGEKSKVLGGILLYGNETKFDATRKLYLKSDSEVLGQIYCKGELSLEGKITGSVYTKYFFKSSKTTEYKNMIVNGKILPMSAETDFGYPDIKINPSYDTNEKIFIEEL